MANSSFHAFLLLFFINACLNLNLIDGKKQGDVLTQFLKSRNIERNVEFNNQFEVLRKGEDLDDVILSQDGLKEKDKITSLPGQPPVKFDQYGGYVTISASHGKAFYYYFIEADSPSKHSLPLLLWLNGGPGCSSLAFGAMTELGAFRVHSDGKTLFYNKFAWNKVANVLFLESPTGVGFSYSNTTSDYSVVGDTKTAHDNYIFLLNWLERFPEYKSRDFYISGESYAGHYVPQLAYTIFQHNKSAKKNRFINFKGLMIGNAVINEGTDSAGMYDYFASHALISDELGKQIRKTCNFSADEVSIECKKHIDASDANTFHVDGLNIYNIYAPICKYSQVTLLPKRTSIRNIDPCIDQYTYTYLNSPDVQKALNANVTNLTYDWEPCSDVLHYNNPKDYVSTVIPELRELMAGGIRIWIFSGDVDGRVPVTSSEYSIASMKLPIKNEWRPWVFNQEVGGYVQVYKGDLTFATVRGAGHEVPSYEPARALTLIASFLKGKPLPAFQDQN
ncbi:serine carboxypeptidase-like 40 [Impatiens glandulifera]|uniref:serine carboxypeptidase-like 40 n=1 Tax=Impatiens glandulifera TaxID=253017 RepID=UPI001FB12172|nr:serine carboxypeptidase-like 40 [Impatiens glandulifera]